MPISHNELQKWALFLGRGVAKLRDLGIAHVGDQLLRLFAELVNLLSLFQVLQERLLVRMMIEQLNELFDRFFAIRVLLLDCRMRYAWYSMVNVAAGGFSVTSRYALVVRGFSCFLLMLILLSTLRVRLQKNSRLRVIVFDKIAILSLELALNCTNTQYFDEVSKDFFVWCDPWLVQVASNFFHALIVVHRVYCSEKH